MTDLVGKRVRVKDSSWLPPTAQSFVGSTGIVSRPANEHGGWWVDFDGGKAWYYEDELEVLDASNSST